MIRLAAIAVALAGCGRLGFGALGDRTTGSANDGGDDGGGGDGALGDGRQTAVDSAPPPPWTLVQAAGGFGPNVGGFNPISAGHLIIVALDTTPVTAVTDDTPLGSNVYMPVPGATATDTTGNNRLEVWYAIAARDGAQIIMVDATTDVTITLWEVAITGPVTVDTAAGLSNQGDTPNPHSPSITTAHANEFIIAFAVGGIESSLDTPTYTEDTTTNLHGWAHVTDAHAPAGSYVASWTTQDVTYCAAAAAFIVSP